MPSALRFSGQKGHPVTQRLRRRVRRDPRATDFDASGIRPYSAEDELGDFRSSGSEEAGEPHDLARPERKVERRHDAAASQSLGHEDRLSLRAVRTGFEALLGLLELATEHQRNQLQPRKLRGRAVPTRRPLRSTEIRSAIR